MIKFNFNANVNIKTNGAPVHRKSLKIFLIVSAVFIFICISSMMVLGSLISSLGSMDQDEEYSQHMEEIAALPGLKCTIHTNTTVKAPLSGKEAAFYALRVGTALQSKDPVEIYETFDYSIIAGYPKGTQVSVDGKLYDIDFKLWMADGMIDQNHFTQKVYATNYKTPYYLQNYQPTENPKVSLLKGRHPWISSFLGTSGLNNILVSEYVFQDGDQVYIKGRIHHNRIVPFVEHMVH
ncbi:hypothetical protein [Chryseobacterium arthrosphaerae]|uniref:Uncharacterized protein n=1 Tax=Chryseobacterium arthrosphaerae TaxID=651561 RepID=A0A1B8ZNY9_9FLAO|nr:hypothetical protein [Chryseobacterium arthrosphaerae]OCA73308.1 hypothetical protein BBI00_02655 [Chryseobacterium arthrosphaerae]